MVWCASPWASKGSSWMGCAHVAGTAFAQPCAGPPPATCATCAAHMGGGGTVEPFVRCFSRIPSAASSHSLLLTTRRAWPWLERPKTMKYFAALKAPTLTAIQHRPAMTHRARLLIAPACGQGMSCQQSEPSPDAHR